MIKLNSINGKEFCLNSDLIYKIEEAPNTIITLVDGKIIRVDNEVDDIIEKIIEFRRQVNFNTELSRPNSPASIGDGFQRADKSSMDTANIQRELELPLNEVSFNPQGADL